MPSDYRKNDLPKAKNLFSEPNDLEDSLKDLDTYEEYVPTDNMFNSDKMDRQVRTKREPYEDAAPIKAKAWGVIPKEQEIGTEPEDGPIRSGLDNFENPKNHPMVPPKIEPIKPKPKPSFNDIAGKITKTLFPKASKENGIGEHKIDNDEKAVYDILEDLDAYEKYLGVNKDTGFKDKPVDIHATPEDTKSKIANELPKKKILDQNVSVGNMDKFLQENKAPKTTANPFDYKKIDEMGNTK